MGISRFLYCLKEGMKNIGRNIWFSLASTAIISACIFLFCLLFALAANVQYMVKRAQATVGITVFFEESLPPEEILKVKEALEGRQGIAKVEYVSAEEAWELFQKEYFEGVEELAAGFADDNPLAGSASIELYLEDISQQEEVVGHLKAVSGIRQINYSNAAASGFTSFGRMVGLISAAVIGILLAVAVFLISNTISRAAASRREENRIMRLIGATNFMIRAPFVFEGMMIGCMGAAIPLAGSYVLYRHMTEYMTEKFQILSNILAFIPIERLFPYMAAVAGALGLGIGFVGSFFTIRRQLKV